MLSMTAVIIAFSLSSCGDDKDAPNPEPEPVLPAYVAVAYSLDLGDGWWDFFDIEVSYTTATGETETKTIHKGWAYVGKVKYNDALSAYTFTATATPKAILPEIDENEKYDFGRDAKAYAFTVNEKDEQTGILSAKNNSMSMSIAGANIAKWLEEHSNLGAGTMTVKK